MSNRLIPLRDLAAEWQLDPSAARRYVVKKKIPMSKRRDPSRGGQHVLCLTPGNAEKARTLRISESVSDAVIPLQDLAAEWQLDPTGARKFVAVLKKIPTIMLHDPSRGGQRVLCLTPENAEEARRLRIAETL
jgi:hypothetical protein